MSATPNDTAPAPARVAITITPELDGFRVQWEDQRGQWEARVRLSWASRPLLNIADIDFRRRLADGKRFAKQAEEHVVYRTYHGVPMDQRAAHTRAWAVEILGEPTYGAVMAAVRDAFPIL